MISMIWATIIVAEAYEQQILYIDKEQPPPITTYTLLKLHIDDRGNPIGLGQEGYIQNSLDSYQEYSIEELASGVVLYQVANVIGSGSLEVIKMYLLPDKIGGWSVRLIYLQDGVWGVKKELKLRLAKEKVGWALLDSKNSMTPKLRLLLNHAPLVGIIGIRNIMPID